MRTAAQSSLPDVLSILILGRKGTKAWCAGRAKADGKNNFCGRPESPIEDPDELALRYSGALCQGGLEKPLQRRRIRWRQDFFII